jgi:hypothetical protein
VRALGKVVVVSRDGIDEEALALGFRADGAAALDRLRRLLRLRRGRSGGEGIADQYAGDAPRRDGAVGVSLEHVAKCLLAFRKPERVQQRDGAFERRLYRRTARIVRRNAPELLGRFACVLRVLRERGGGHAEAERKEQR